jgi:hypothetical protein
MSSDVMSYLDINRLIGSFSALLVNLPKNAIPIGFFMLLDYIEPMISSTAVAGNSPWDLFIKNTFLVAKFMVFQMTGTVSGPSVASG